MGGTNVVAIHYLMDQVADPSEGFTGVGEPMDFEVRSIHGEKESIAQAGDQLPSSHATVHADPHRAMHAGAWGIKGQSDVNFSHDFRNAKVGAVVDISHDDINPFNFFHWDS